MITIEHIKIYQLYHGDGDGFVRFSNPNEKDFMSYETWTLISNFIQDIFIINKGLASKEFSDNLAKRLKEKCDNEETIKALMRIES